MGYGLARFHGEVDEELICSICSEVFEDPVQGPCEHAFCRACISERILRQPTCPVDRAVITNGELRPVPRLLRTLLSRLSISCLYSSYGCQVVLNLETLPSHLEGCLFNPKRMIPCEKGCGIEISKDKQEDHDCVKELLALMNVEHKKMSDLQDETAKLYRLIDEQKRQIGLFKGFMQTIKGVSPAVKALVDQMEKDEVLHWANSLPIAHVVTWGSLEATPGADLQNEIKSALEEAGCPTHVLDTLIVNSHQAHWPHGLSEVRRRVHNRPHCENFVCRRVPGKQAVLIFPSDNNDVGDEFMKEPGMLMIFTWGVE